MTITAFYPALYVNDLDAALAEYESLGFKRLHTIEDEYIKQHVMEINGNRIDLFTSNLPQLPKKEGFYTIRVNVTDIDEGLAYYQAKGYKPLHDVVEKSFLKCVLMKDEDEHRIFLFQHIKKDK